MCTRIYSQVRINLLPKLLEGVGSPGYPSEVVGIHWGTSPLVWEGVLKKRAIFGFFETSEKHPERVQTEVKTRLGSQTGVDVNRWMRWVPEGYLAHGRRPGGILAVKLDLIYSHL